MATPTLDAAWSSSRTAMSAGPLVTLFTPPEDCAMEAAITYINPASFRPAVLGFMPGSAWASGFLEQSAISNTCYPPGTPARQVTGYFSPGVFCPLGWTSALTFISSQVRFNTFQTFTASGAQVSSKLSEYFRSLHPSETMVLCCPGAQRPIFTIDPTDANLRCRGHYAGTTSVTLYGYGANSSPVTAGATTRWVYSADPTTHSLVLAPIGEVPSYTIAIPFNTTATGSSSVTATMDVYPIQLRWQATDESLRNVSGGGSPGTGTRGGAGATETVIITAGTAISTGGIAGIAVGCTAVASLLMLAVFFILRYRRRMLAARKADKGNSPAELPGDEKDPEKDPIELQDARRMELADATRLEMGAGREHWEIGEGRDRWELNGDTGYWELGGPRQVPGMYELDVGALRRRDDLKKLALDGDEEKSKMDWGEEKSKLGEKLDWEKEKRDEKKERKRDDDERTGRKPGDEKEDQGYETFKVKVER